MSNIADKVGIGNEVREFKLGRSFAGNSATAFHSIRYDFKPASVDTSKMATLAIGERQQVTVNVPHVESNAQAVFMGSKKQYQKECVLIIDHNTGEITLEKLSSNMQLKKTRSEGSSRSLQGRPITPIDTPSLPPPPVPSTHQKKPSPPNQTRFSPSSNLSYQPKASPNQQRSSPWTSSSPQTSPNNPSLVASHHSHSNSSNPSMPNFLSGTTISPPGSFPNQSSSIPRNSHVAQPPNVVVSPSMPQFLASGETKNVAEIGVLSESSSDSSSGSSSGDDDEDNERPPKMQNQVNNHSKLENEHKKRRSSVSGSSSSGASIHSDSEDPDEHLRTNHRHKPTPAPPAPGGNAASQPVSGGNSTFMPSMPKFSQLSADLELSESGSDSDV